MNEIFLRQSIRKYTDEPVSQQDIEDLLKAGMQAPSAVNQQPWEFYVVTDKELLKKLSEVAPHSKPLADAPLGIVLAYRKNATEVSYAPTDMALCAENIMLEAVSLKLGSVMLGIYPNKGRIEAVRELLDIPESLEPFTILSIGHPAESRKIQERFDPSRIHYIS